jgi:hypothetical protein
MLLVLHCQGSGALDRLVNVVLARVVRAKLYRLKSGKEEWLDYDRIFKILRGVKYWSTRAGKTWTPRTPFPKESSFCGVT